MKGAPHRLCIAFSKYKNAKKYGIANHLKCQLQCDCTCCTSIAFFLFLYVCSPKLTVEALCSNLNCRTTLTLLYTEWPHCAKCPQSKIIFQSSRRVLQSSLSSRNDEADKVSRPHPCSCHPQWYVPSCVNLNPCCAVKSRVLKIQHRSH